MADGTESSPNASSASASVTPGSPVSFIVTVNSSSRSMKASLAAALLLSNLGLAQTPSTPIPSTLFGMHTSGSARWPGTPVGALGKGTCEGWANEEPTRGVFNWSITDGFVAAARDHGVTHFAVPGWLPQWAENPAYATGVCQTQTYCGGFTACRRMPLLADWDAYITARLQRYKSTGVQAGCSSSNPQCHGVIQLWELWNEPNTIHTDITAMLAIMAKYGLSSKPLWNTEGSWDQYHPITTDDQAGYPARSYLLQWSLGVQRFYWYQWGNARWGTIE